MIILSIKIIVSICLNLVFFVSHFLEAGVAVGLDTV